MQHMERSACTYPPCTWLAEDELAYPKLFPHLHFAPRAQATYCSLTLSCLDVAASCLVSHIDVENNPHVQPDQVSMITLCYLVQAFSLAIYIPFLLRNALWVLRLGVTAESAFEELPLALWRRLFEWLPTVDFVSKYSNEHRPGVVTYTLCLIISSTSLCSPSATWMTSSIKPPPSLFSSSDMLRLLAHDIH